MAGKDAKGMAAPDADGAGARRRRQAWRTAGVLGMIVAGVLAAWLVGEVVRAYLESSRRTDPGQVFRPGPATQPDWVPGDLDEILSTPYAVAGLRDLRGDPGGVPPPRGARRLRGCQRDLPDQAEQQVWYELPDGADAAAHYRRELGSRGLTLLRDAAEPTGRRILVFSKGLSYATVRFPENLGLTGRVIIVTWVEPAPSGKANGR